ncbi:hypothetical protein [Novosphingobium sp. BL-52-GroH]|uniref:hypothetical protein n=1 Tax=Novosphingobium sp. BL-52-GroH TaxID=3349877 RepID=UPI00384DE0A4
MRGHWVIFFSHPADSTPVCSKEFAELARGPDLLVGTLPSEAASIAAEIGVVGAF